MVMTNVVAIVNLFAGLYVYALYQVSSLYGKTTALVSNALNILHPVSVFSIDNIFTSLGTNMQISPVPTLISRLTIFFISCAWAISMSVMGNTS